MISIRPARLSRIVASVAALLLFASFPSHADSTEQKAWTMFECAAKSKSASERATGIQALGLMKDNARARAMAEAALKDVRPEVRAAAATALGQMHATESIPKLQEMLGDKRISVVMAAANSLRALKDDKSAYGIYLDVLTGERKGDGLVTQQVDTLHNPHEMAMIGIEEGIGFVPFAGIGWDAWRYTHKKNPHPVRAVAATLLARDPDPATGKALVKAALHDKDWIVRAAAVEAIAQRGDSALGEKIAISLFDRNVHVRYTAAAAVIRRAASSEAEAHKTAGTKAVESKTAAALR
jgi:HEAT repeat protein